jgi:peptidoglycan/LPS O-acetylase OafA/YrhL
MLRGDVLGGVLYVSNWFQIWSGSSYTSAFAFAPLRHLWSLAVEEQYYIVWPLVMFVLLRRLSSRTLPILGLVFTAAAIGIGIWTAVLYQSGPIDTFANTPEQYMTIFGHRVLRIDFIYLGTITRASGLLLGAALATMWRPWAIRRADAGVNANALDVAGALALGALGVMCWKMREIVNVTDGGTQAYDLLYRGGLIAVALATIIAIAMVTHPRSRLGKYVIGSPLLVWIGKRSYGLYLYHWTIFQAYRKNAGNALDLREFIALMAITIVVTEASFQFIETPIRTGKAVAGFRSWRQRGGRVGGPLAILLGTLAVIPIFAVVSMAGAKVIPDDITAGLDDNESAVTSITTTTLANTPTTQPAVTTTALPKGRIEMLAVGDSVMLGAARKLTSFGLTVDAAKNRQVLDALQIFNYYKSTNELGNNVVIHLGTNGTTRTSTFESILKPLAGVQRIIVLTVHVPGREYEAINNKIINALPLTHPNVTILDWDALATPHKDWFASDGIHLNALGQDNYIQLILQALGR